MSPHARHFMQNKHVNNYKKMITNRPNITLKNIISKICNKEGRNIRDSVEFLPSMNAMLLVFISLILIVPNIKSLSHPDRWWKLKGCDANVGSQSTNIY